jgi:hypothetical protein
MHGAESYEPDELPGCSTPHCKCGVGKGRRQIPTNLVIETNYALAPAPRLERKRGSFSGLSLLLVELWERVVREWQWRAP